MAMFPRIIYQYLGFSRTSAGYSCTRKTWNKCPTMGNGGVVIFFIILQILGCISRTYAVPNNRIQNGDTKLLVDTLNSLDSKDYAIVVPIQVDPSGDYLSHSIHPVRTKRSLNSNSNQDGGPSNNKATLNYKFAAHGQDFHLEISPNEELLAPKFAIQRRKNGRTEHVEYIPELENCHYAGKSLSHPGSTVAVSICDGLTGLVRTSEDDFIIEPLSSHLAEKHNYQSQGDDHVPHVIYKRSADQRKVSMAPRKEEAEEGDEKKKNKKPKAKRKHRHDKNVNGTKQHFCGRRKKYQPHPPEDPIFFVDEYDLHEHNLPTNDNKTVLERSRRSISGNIHRNRYIETLVVVDKMMMKRHGKARINTYVLTVFNMVASLFRDTSLGNTVNMVLTSLLILEDDQSGLNINHHADHSLNSFCQWQSMLTTPTGGKHDHAILLTGMDICSWKNEPCDTLGFAPIGGMCSKYRSCTINEDTGLGLAFTVAHESGHSFGMVHDGDGNECKKSGGKIMSATLSGNNGRFLWSACSRDYLEDFLSTDRASCTTNEPRAIAEYQFPNKLPGELYDADQQCQWQFGSGARLCSFNFGKSLCQSIWCHRDERRCETKFLPAADGTGCGSGRWCIQGNCVARGNKGPPPIDGDFADYGEYSECSRSCGGGVQFKERQCNNPRPQNGGRYCEGAGRIYRMCNIQECASTAVDFRDTQCAEYNSKPFRGFYYQWKPYPHVIRRESCKLYCMADGYDFYFALASKVIDGTPCNKGSTDVCVSGRCEHVGCDNVLGSEAVADSCGVCNGDNSTCDFVSGIYTEQHTQNDYYEVVRIPSGARQIKIEEKASSSSYLALRNSKYKYYLTGGWTVDWPGDFDFAGTTFEYRRPYNKPEYLSAEGPTSEELVVEILLQGVNPGIAYKYTVRKEVELEELQIIVTQAPVYNYTWNVVKSECSASCAGGRRSRQVYCMRDGDQEVDDSFCDTYTKPSTAPELCNSEPCPPRWLTSSWDTCSEKCGGGSQKRQIMCVQDTMTQTEVQIKARLCDKTKKPLRWQKCNMDDCPPRWITTRWTECSATCGPGYEVRSITCNLVYDGGRHQRLPNTRCRSQVRPRERRPCNLKKCPLNVQWFISAWSECSTTCGLGKRNRIVKCSHLDNEGQYNELPEDNCENISKPNLALTKPCNNAPCHVEAAAITAVWSSSSWSECSRTCGGGTRTRDVTCTSTNQQAVAARCVYSVKPTIVESCNTDRCTSTRQSAPPYNCRDEYSWCNLVPQHRMCSHNFYGAKCCYSCHYRRS